MSAKEALLHTLFEIPGTEHVNIKFLRGTSQGITEEAFCSQVNAALFEADHERITPMEHLPEDLTPIDVCLLVG